MDTPRDKKSYILYTVFFLVFLCILLMDRSRYSRYLNHVKGKNVKYKKADKIAMTHNRMTSDMKEVESKQKKTGEPAKSGTNIISMKYSVPFNNSKGKSMVAPRDMLEAMNFPSGDFAEPTRELWDSFVFATVIGIFNFAECLQMLASVQANFPGRKIYVFGFKLKQHQVMKLTAICNAEYRPFVFSKYPRHIRRTKSMAFKAIMIQEILQKHKGVFWLDSWARLVMDESKFKENIHPILDKSGGIAMFIKGKHSVYAATRPGLYDYLPSNQEKLKTIRMLSTGAFILFRTKTLYQNIFRWLMMCSLNPLCIAPPPIGPVCTLKLLEQASPTFKYNMFSGCHEYDHSIISILLANQYQFSDSDYFFGKNTVVVRKKEMKNFFKIKFC